MPVMVVISWNCEFDVILKLAPRKSREALTAQAAFE